MSESPDIRRAAEAVVAADALVITAGAGMGVDSGLPDFRGNEGFWNAYPGAAKLGLRFKQLANPRWFTDDPNLAWGFYGHRMNLYRQTTPHDGFGILLRWAKARSHGYFVFTSNVDGHFQKAGFDPERVEECHGSLNHLQCVRDCRGEIWPAEGHTVVVDESTLRAADPLPRCPYCGSTARPNVLMFGDGGWSEARSQEQGFRFQQWLRRVSGSIVVIECGAGTGIPTVRDQSEMLVARHDATLIRINIREPQVPPGHIGLPMPAREALAQIDRVIVSS